MNRADAPKPAPRFLHRSLCQKKKKKRHYYQTFWDFSFFSILPARLRAPFVVIAVSRCRLRQTEAKSTAFQFPKPTCPLAPGPTGES